jgi:uncharacterized protein (TIGR01319 family)
VIAVDIGSTYIKSLDCENDNAAIKFRKRDYRKTLKCQLTNLLSCYDVVNSVRICSSANGGLKVGIVCLTEKISGNILKELCLSAGCNIRYVYQIREDPIRLEYVDVLVLCGGVDNTEQKHLKSYFNQLLEINRHIKQVIFAGAIESAPKSVGSIRFVENPLSNGFYVKARDIVNLLQKIYLNDLIDSGSMTTISTLSDRAILPTPAVVSQFYKQSMQTGIDWLDVEPPYLLVDVGGATTDVYASLAMVNIDGDSHSKQLPDTFRRVYVDLGVEASKSSLEAEIFRHPKRLELLKILYKESLPEVLDKIDNKLLPHSDSFAACVFLALHRVIWESEDAICADKVQTIVLTGGITKVGVEEIVSDILKLVFPRRFIRLVVDNEYRIWTAGMRLMEEYN